MEDKPIDKGFEERVTDIKSKLKDIQSGVLEKLNKEDYLEKVRSIVHDHNKEFIASGLVALVGTVAILTYFKTQKGSKKESTVKILSISPNGFAPHSYIDSEGVFVYLTDDDKILDPDKRPFGSEQEKK